MSLRYALAEVAEEVLPHRTAHLSCETPLSLPPSSSLPLRGPLPSSSSSVQYSEGPLRGPSSTASLYPRGEPVFRGLHPEDPRTNMPSGHPWDGKRAPSRKDTRSPHETSPMGDHTSYSHTFLQSAATPNRKTSWQGEEKGAHSRPCGAAWGHSSPPFTVSPSFTHGTASEASGSSFSYYGGYSYTTATTTHPADKNETKDDHYATRPRGSPSYESRGGERSREANKKEAQETDENTYRINALMRLAGDGFLYGLAVEHMTGSSPPALHPFLLGALRERRGKRRTARTEEVPRPPTPSPVLSHSRSRSSSISSSPPPVYVISGMEGKMMEREWKPHPSQTYGGPRTSCSSYASSITGAGESHCPPPPHPSSFATFPWKSSPRYGMEKKPPSGWLSGKISALLTPRVEKKHDQTHPHKRTPTTPPPQERSEKGAEEEERKQSVSAFHFLLRWMWQEGILKDHDIQHLRRAAKRFLHSSSAGASSRAIASSRGGDPIPTRKAKETSHRDPKSSHPWNGSNTTWKGSTISSSLKGTKRGGATARSDLLRIATALAHTPLILTENGSRAAHANVATPHGPVFFLEGHLRLTEVLLLYALHQAMDGVVDAGNVDQHVTLLEECCTGAIKAPSSTKRSSRSREGRAHEKQTETPPATAVRSTMERHHRHGALPHHDGEEISSLLAALSPSSVQYIMGTIAAPPLPVAQWNPKAEENETSKDPLSLSQKETEKALLRWLQTVLYYEECFQQRASTDPHKRKRKAQKRPHPQEDAPRCPPCTSPSEAASYSKGSSPSFSSPPPPTSSTALGTETPRSHRHSASSSSYSFSYDSDYFSSSANRDDASWFSNEDASEGKKTTTPLATPITALHSPYHRLLHVCTSEVGRAKDLYEAVKSGTALAIVFHFYLPSSIPDPYTATHPSSFAASTGTAAIPASRGSKSTASTPSTHASCVSAPSMKKDVTPFSVTTLGTPGTVGMWDLVLQYTSTVLGYTPPFCASEAFAYAESGLSLHIFALVQHVFHRLRTISEEEVRRRLLHGILRSPDGLASQEVPQNDNQPNGGRPGHEAFMSSAGKRNKIPLEATHTTWDTSSEHSRWTSYSMHPSTVDRRHVRKKKGSPPHPSQRRLCGGLLRFCHLKEEENDETDGSTLAVEGQEERYTGPSSRRSSVYGSPGVSLVEHSSLLPSSSSPLPRIPPEVVHKVLQRMDHSTHTTSKVACTTGGSIRSPPPTSGKSSATYTSTRTTSPVTEEQRKSMKEKHSTTKNQRHEPPQLDVKSRNAPLKRSSLPCVNEALLDSIVSRVRQQLPRAAENTKNTTPDAHWNTGPGEAGGRKESPPTATHQGRRTHAPTQDNKTPLTRPTTLAKRHSPTRSSSRSGPREERVQERVGNGYMVVQVPPLQPMTARRRGERPPRAPSPGKTSKKATEPHPTGDVAACSMGCPSSYGPYIVTAYSTTSPCSSSVRSVGREKVEKKRHPHPHPAHVVPRDGKTKKTSSHPPPHHHHKEHPPDASKRTGKGQSESLLHPSTSAAPSRGTPPTTSSTPLRSSPPVVVPPSPAALSPAGISPPPGKPIPPPAKRSVGTPLRSFTAPFPSRRGVTSSSPPPPRHPLFTSYSSTAARSLLSGSSVVYASTYTTSSWWQSYDAPDSCTHLPPPAMRVSYTEGILSSRSSSYSTSYSSSYSASSRGRNRRPSSHRQGQQRNLSPKASSSSMVSYTSRSSYSSASCTSSSASSRSVSERRPHTKPQKDSHATTPERREPHSTTRKRASTPAKTTTTTVKVSKRTSLHGEAPTKRGAPPQEQRTQKERTKPSSGCTKGEASTSSFTSYDEKEYRSENEKRVITRSSSRCSYSYNVYDDTAPPSTSPPTRTRNTISPRAVCPPSSLLLQQQSSPSLSKPPPQPSPPPSSMRMRSLLKQHVQSTAPPPPPTWTLTKGKTTPVVVPPVSREASPERPPPQRATEEQRPAVGSRPLSSEKVNPVRHVTPVKTPVPPSPSRAEWASKEARVPPHETEEPTSRSVEAYTSTKKRRRKRGGRRKRKSKGALEKEEGKGNDSKNGSHQKSGTMKEREPNPLLAPSLRHIPQEPPWRSPEKMDKDVPAKITEREERAASHTHPRDLSREKETKDPVPPEKKKESPRRNPKKVDTEKEKKLQRGQSTRSSFVSIVDEIVLPRSPLSTSLRARGSSLPSLRYSAATIQRFYQALPRRHRHKHLKTSCRGSKKHTTVPLSNGEKMVTAPSSGSPASLSMRTEDVAMQSTGAVHPILSLLWPSTSSSGVSFTHSCATVAWTESSSSLLDGAPLPVDLTPAKKMNSRRAGPRVEQRVKEKAVQTPPPSRLLYPPPAEYPAPLPPPYVQSVAVASNKEASSSPLVVHGAEPMPSSALPEHAKLKKTQKEQRGRTPNGHPKEEKKHRTGTRSSFSDARERDAEPKRKEKEWMGALWSSAPASTYTYSSSSSSFPFQLPPPQTRNAPGDVKGATAQESRPASTAAVPPTTVDPQPRASASSSLSSPYAATPREQLIGAPPCVPPRRR